MTQTKAGSSPESTDCSCRMNLQTLYLGYSCWRTEDGPDRMVNKRILKIFCAAAAVTEAMLTLRPIGLS